MADLRTTCALALALVGVASVAAVAPAVAAEPGRAERVSGQSRFTPPHPLSAAGSAKRSKARRCAKGQVMVVVKGRGFRVVAKPPRKGRVLCFKRPAVTTTAAQVRSEARRLLDHPRLRPSYLKRLERNRGLRALRPFARRLERIVGGEAVARARASREVQTESSNIADQAFGGKEVPGGSATAQMTSEAPDAGEVGNYAEMGGEIAIANNGARVAQRQVVGLGQFAKLCPDAGGIVEGVVKFKKGEGMTAQGPGMKAVSYDLGMSFETKFRARVGDDGRWTDYSYTGTGAMETEGYGTDGRYFSQVYRVAYNWGPVARDAPFVFDESTYLRMLERMQGRGPRGSNLDASEVKIVVSVGMMAAAFTPTAVTELLKKAEKHWYDDEGCLQVDLAPKPLSLEPGQTRPVGVAVTPKAGGAGVAAKIEAQGGNGATVTPATTRSPAELSFTAPGTRWDSSPLNAPMVNVQATSRQGRASGGLYAEPLPPLVRFPRAMRGTVSGTLRYDGGVVETYSGTLSTQLDGIASPSGATYNLSGATIGTIAWSISGSDASGCTYAGAATLDASLEGLVNRVADGSYTQTFWVEQNRPHPIGTRTCPITGGQPYTGLFPSMGGRSIQGDPVAWDKGLTFKGTFTHDSAAGGGRRTEWSYDLRSTE